MTRSKTATFELRLLPTEEQLNALAALRDVMAPLEAASAEFPFRLAKKFGIDRAILVPGPLFSVHSDNVVVRGIGRLRILTLASYRPKGLRKKYLAFVEKSSGWSAYITMETPSRKKPDQSKRRERLHNGAAIFITDKSPARKISGGLPSLGKRR